VISCSEAVRRLWDYLERDLDEANREQVEDHLAFCRRCCGEVEFAEELRTLLASSVRPHLPPDVEGRLTGFLDQLEEDAP
jgi:anti-sigma factor (TIGR02949 family)